MAGETPPAFQGPRNSRGQLVWSVVLNTILVAAFVLGVIPMVAIARGFVELVSRSQIRSGADWVGYGFAFTGLLMGAIFFAYAIKYYLSTAMVLLTTLVGGGSRNGNGSNGSPGGNGLNRINGNANGNHIDLGYYPFVSVHVAAYNEKRVIERLLEALDKLDYPEYEVVLVDDSTDESVQILQRWRDRPRFKILHRTSRAGYKGGALREALKVTDPRTEYVVVFDADSVPFPDSIQRLLPLFYRVSEERASNRRLESAFGRSDPPSEPGQIKRRSEVAAVQSYQWHVLNKSESWLTEAVRVEYAGSYMVERPFQDAIGALKMIAGTAYMIRADVLREVGWGTSITEDWELTLKLYARGYKVVYTPWAETPAECVSTFSRLARQRMRWAEGHTYNVRKYFLPILRSPFVSPLEKLEFLYDSSYYLQAGLFVIGSATWLISELVLHTHVPGWTALLGWSLLFSNVFALPLMNLGGLILEEAPARDFQGVWGALVLSFALAPFQAWAAIKGLISKDEGPWFRTPKTGRVTDQVHHLRRLNLLRRWLMGPSARRLDWKSPASGTSSVARVSGRIRNRWVGWAVALALLATFGGMAWLASKAPVVSAAGNPLYLRGSGAAPCTATTLDPLNGPRTLASACTAAPGVTTTWGFASPVTQTVASGTWDFTMYWSGGTGNANNTVAITAGVSATASCATFAATIPNPGTTWTTTFGSAATNTSSPFTVSTAGPLPAGGLQLALLIPQGGSLCLSVTVTHNTGGPVLLLYDGSIGAGDTQVVPPSTVVPESLLGFLGWALLIPLFTARRRLFALVRIRK